MASTLAAHSSLCRHLNTSSKNIKQLNRLINTYLDQPDIDSRVLVCGRAASGVSGTSLASPQKLNRVVVALKTIEDTCHDDDEEMLSPVMKTDVLQKLIAEKTRHVKQVIKTSFEIDSLSLKHAKVSPTKRLLLIRNGRRGYKRTPSTVSRDGGGDGGSCEEKQEKEKGERNDELERREFKSNRSTTTTTTTRQRVHASCIECMQSPRQLCVNCAAPAPGATEKKKSSDGGDTGGDGDPVMSLRRTYSTTHVNAPEELLDVRHSGHQPTCISDFQILKPISQGAFGSVYLVRKKKTGDLFA